MNYYCCDCGKLLDEMSDYVIDRLGVSHYDDSMCRKCAAEELAYLRSECPEDDDSDLHGFNHTSVGA